MPKIIVSVPGPAVVAKLPKLHRSPQRWRAECPECPRKANAPTSTPHWMGYASRRALTAKYDAERHNREQHPEAVAS